MTSRLHLSVLALGLTLAAFGCGKDNPTTPTPPADPKFTATLSPANETTAVVGGDVTGSGTVTITVHPTKDAAGNVTAATADFTVTLQGFPAGTVLTGAHIHPGAAGVAGGVVWSLGRVDDFHEERGQPGRRGHRAGGVEQSSRLLFQRAHDRQWRRCRTRSVGEGELVSRLKTLGFGL
jgi:hypothetical protein